MIYLEYENDGRVTLQHFMPFDAINGIKNSQGDICTQEELLSKGGILINSIPTPDNTIDKDATLCVNLSTKKLYYVYTERPQTDADRISNLEIAIANMMGV